MALISMTIAVILATPSESFPTSLSDRRFGNVQLQISAGSLQPTAARRRLGLFLTQKLSEV
jgi:hypothetical protein